MQPALKKEMQVKTVDAWLCFMHKRAYTRACNKFRKFLQKFSNLFSPIKSRDTFLTWKNLQGKDGIELRR